MAYLSTVHESTGVSPLGSCLGRNVHCLWMLVFRGRNRTCRTSTSPNGFVMHWRWRMIRPLDIRVGGTTSEKTLCRRAVRRMFAVGDRVLRYYSPAKKLNWIPLGLVRILLCPWQVGRSGFSDIRSLYIART